MTEHHSHNNDLMSWHRVKGGKAVYCHEHSVLETWWNQKYVYPKLNLRVRVGELWKEMPGEQHKESIRGKHENVITPIDAERHLFKRDTNGEIVGIDVYTWLEDAEGRVWDVNRRKWNSNGKFALECYTAIEGMSKADLANIYGAHYDPIPVPETEKYVLDVLEKTYGDHFKLMENPA